MGKRLVHHHFGLVLSLQVFFFDYLDIMEDALDRVIIVQHLKPIARKPIWLVLAPTLNQSKREGKNSQHIWQSLVLHWPPIL